ncbi:MAG: agmatine deiminase family protein [Akkermansia sp.]
MSLKTKSLMDKIDVRWPAEWEPQEAVWLSWPHREDLWQGGLEALYDTFGSVASAIAPYAQVRINAAESLHRGIEEVLTSKGVKKDTYRLYPHPTNDVWCRDHGPIFVRELVSGGLCLTDWQFNAWGGKFAPWDLDNKIPHLIGDSLGLARRESEMILEGGAIEGNGAGLLLTTEAVLLNPNRNPEWSKDAVEAELKRMLGVSSIFWLGRGIEGDDTDGHIDDMVRFIREDAVVSIVEKNSKSPHYQALSENNERLQEMRTVDGHCVEIIPLPMPDALVATDWRLEQLPASYANFLIVNEAVIVPIFDQKRNDDRALGILREVFPKQKVIGVDARRLVIEGGAIHCITQQQPQTGVTNQ